MRQNADNGGSVGARNRRLTKPKALWKRFAKKDTGGKIETYPANSINTGVVNGHRDSYQC